MGDILDEASALIQCKECPWYKSCVSPLRFTMEDLTRQLQLGTAEPSTGLDMQKLFSELASATQNLLLESCPVFMNRLRANPELARQIKRIMQTWGTERDEPASESKSPG